jgi:hypothetical protein
LLLAQLPTDHQALKVNFITTQVSTVYWPMTVLHGFRLLQKSLQLGILLLQAAAAAALETATTLVAAVAVVAALGNLLLLRCC